MCCTQLAENMGCKKIPMGARCTIAQLCWAISSQLRHISTTWKKLVKQQYLIDMSSHYGELQPTNGWDRLASLGHPSKFQPVLRLGFSTAPTLFVRGQPNFAWCLAVSWAGTLYIHFFGGGGSCPLTEFCQVQRFSQFDQQHSTECATYIRLGDHHVWHRPILLLCTQMWD